MDVYSRYRQNIFIHTITKCPSYHFLCKPGHQVLVTICRATFICFDPYPENRYQGIVPRFSQKLQLEHFVSICIKSFDDLLNENPIKQLFFLVLNS